jgi:Tfp pilus assembly protein FimV
MEPISATIITALVGLYTAYTTYKVGMAQAEAQGKPAPTKTEDVQKGEQVAQVVETGIQQHGNAEEQSTLPLYQANPARFESIMQDMMRDLARREPAFNQQLQDVAKQTNVAQTGGVRGEAHVHGTNSGINIGANTGSVSQNNQTINNQASNRGAQGTFHGPVNFGKDNE